MTREPATEPPEIAALDRPRRCGRIGGVSRLLALAVALGLLGPGIAEAQVWKVKKTGKPAATKPAKKASAARASRPTLKKKKAVRPKKREVPLVPEDDDESVTEAEPRDRDPVPDEDPIIIKVEEVFD
jgi:hypothetical protein